jgi:hypothetical protein
MPTGRIREVSVLEYGLNECVFLTVRERAMDDSQVSGS